MQVLIPVEIPDLHEQLKKARNLAKLSQSELSKRTDMSFQNIQRIERSEEKGGAKSIPWETLEQLLEALGLPCSQIEAAKLQAADLFSQSLDNLMTQVEKAKEK